MVAKQQIPDKIGALGSVSTGTFSNLNSQSYVKVLREFVNGKQEWYLTTQYERDQETGLDYRGTRYHDGDVGRFLSLDPLAKNYPTLNDYSYVLENFKWVLSISYFATSGFV